MPSTPTQHPPGAEPRNDQARDTKPIMEDADKGNDRERDLVHGEGGTIGLPDNPRNISRDD